MGSTKRQYVVRGTTFDVDERYEVKKGVGQGAYGLICAARDAVSGEQVAVTRTPPSSADRLRATTPDLAAFIGLCQPLLCGWTDQPPHVGARRMRLGHSASLAGSH